MKLAAFILALGLTTLAVPAATAFPWTCVHSIAGFACAGEYEWGDDAPGCAVTGTYVWLKSGTSAALWGMGCESGYRAMGGGGTAVNMTGVGFHWVTDPACPLTVWNADYTTYQWTIVPVCAAPPPPDGIAWGYVLP